ncbi:MarR family transcriptional regulator [Nocardioides sp. CBS4Y-1]|uniref:MarR family transcriptional regulator n=1 Tax=Nocardioides acrostichi TaxID=2784339 RepID=A0A930YCB4_9ACTN|nr:MarR family transcriptional regulator [Nocardioides acrostichi]
MSENSSEGEAAGHPGGPATGFVDAWRQTGSLEALRRAVREAGRVRPAVTRRSGLSVTELATLELLVERPVGLAELARHLEVSTAAATGVGDRLEAHGHAERRAHPRDRRRTDLHITASGREEVLGHLLPMFARLAELDAGFSAAERAVVARYLDGAAEAFAAMTRDDA